MLIIKGNRILLPQGFVSAAVYIADGKIVAVTSHSDIPQHAVVTDIGDNVLMPGVIDPHVHINEPGRVEWEGFDTATKAAIAGGVTTLVDMPLNSSPVTTTVEAFEKKLLATEGKLHTNVGFWGGLVPGNADQVQGLIDKGVLGFKAFLAHSGIDEFPNVTAVDLDQSMPIIAKSGEPLLVHCEITDDINRSTDDVCSYINYLGTRPKHWEDKAIALMIQKAEQHQCKTHIVHLSSADSIRQLQQAKSKGLPVTVETAQHYLYFNAEEIINGRTDLKCAPPIRDKANNDQLWEALQNGLIDFVATDHSPATADLKEINSGNFMKAWGGIASIQLALPALWTAARKRDIGFEHIAKWLCENPAKLAGLANQKGKIAVGYDADLIVIDIDASFTVNEDDILHKNKVTPYKNEMMWGVVKQTYLGGELVVDEGKIVTLNKGKIILNK